ncbi:MAG TPA: MauE/DoxX family redox-associated membrane protein, partial [Streptosporangiaceae bacterium]
LRAAAAAEIVVAAALPVPSLRVPAAAAAALLGLSFMALGLLGAARHSEAPCGCFGSSGKRPLGWVNVLLGLAIVLVLPANAAGSAGERYPEAVLLLTSILSIALCIYMRRELVVQLLVPKRGVPAESEAH